MHATWVVLALVASLAHSVHGYSKDQRRNTTSLLELTGLSEPVPLVQRNCPFFHVVTAYSSVAKDGAAVVIQFTKSANKRVPANKRIMCGIVLANGSPAITPMVASVLRGTCRFPLDSIPESLPATVYFFANGFRERFERLSHTNTSIPASKDLCPVPVREITRPTNPSMFLMGVTEIRSAADSILDWVKFHLFIGFDHIVIYDDGSKDNITEVLDPFVTANLVTYLNWTKVSNHPQSHYSRQFLAMEVLVWVFFLLLEILIRSSSRVAGFCVAICSPR